MRRSWWPPCPLLAAAALTAGLALANPLAVANEPWTLERAVERALAANPDARLARARVVGADARVEQEPATFQPRLTLGTGYVRTDNPTRVFGTILDQREYDPALDFNDVPDADNLNVHGLLVVPLYQGGAGAAGREQAEAWSTAARHQDQAVRRGIEYEVARVFFTVHKTHAFVEATEAAVAAFGSSLEIVRRRNVAGTALKSDVLDVQVRLARAREDLVRARNAHLLAKRALRNLLALEEEELEVAGSGAVLAVPDAEVAPERPELIAAAELRRAAEAGERSARGGHLPRVDAFGRLDHNRGWEFDGAGNSYAAGVELRWDAWDGQRTRALVHEAQANVEVAVEQERKTRLAVDLEVAAAQFELRAAEERLAVTATVTDQAAESAELTRARFEQGLALATQLIDAETELTGARVRRAEAEADREIAVAALRRALGLPLLVGRAEGP